MLEKFIKSYSGPYKYTAMVRHKGVVIAFAMDDHRKIFYAALDMNSAPRDSGAARSPFDIDSWPGSPTQLIFPNEIAEVGFGVADQTLIPTYPKGIRTPVEPGTRLSNKDKDLFLSTTARLSADAQFQALSDGRFVYVFRQAIDAEHADMVFKQDKDGNPIKDKDGMPVPLVDGTLLVDRFVMVGTALTPKLEVRFQRSRSKTRPQSRKDSLGAKDLDGNDFFEPTQELKFVENLTGGRFTALLLPTQVAELERWQIFAQNRRTGSIDSFNVERSADGLFNTRGSQVFTCSDHPGVFAKQAGTCVEPSLVEPSQNCGKNLIPRLSTEGYAESALRFENDGDHVTFKAGTTIAGIFTQEAWIFPESSQSTSTSPQVLIDGGLTIWLEAQTRLRVGFGDGADRKVITSTSILAPKTWNHLAVVFDGMACRFYVNGNLRDKINLPDAGAPAAASLLGFGATQNSFHGIIDEIRLWDRVRSSRELQEDMHQRLTGLEPGLVGYWRFDEAEGDTVYDQTNNGIHGTVHGCQWVTSDAPVGENPGVNRSSFQLAARTTGGQLEKRTFESGMTALLYFQQANVPSGYDGKEKPLKQNARLMLAVATKGSADDDQPYIAALDFGVSSSGRIAQTPDRIPLNIIDSEHAAQKSINDQLEEIRAAEAAVRLHGEAVVNAKRERDLRQREYDTLKNELEAIEARKVAVWGIPLNSRNVVRLEREVGEITYNELMDQGLNDRIIYIDIPVHLQVTVYEDANWQGKSELFKTTQDFMVNHEESPEEAEFSGWGARISGLRIADNPDYKAYKDRLDRTAERLQQARDEVKTQETHLKDAQKSLDGLKSVLRTGAEVVMPLVQVDSFGLSTSGGLLGFAWTQDTPLLFDSATGSLALYFRGDKDQFFATYFNTFTERARYPLTDKNKQESVICVARSTDLDMDKIVVEVSGDENSDTCIVTINGAGMLETWTQVPRDPERFARVLNGEAGHYENKRLVGYREYIGSGFFVTGSGQLSLNIPEGLRHALEAGAALQVGETRAWVPEAVKDGEINIPITSDALSFTTEKLPIYFMEYDYAADAQTTKVPSDLFGGSLLIRAVSVASESVASGLVGNQRVTSGATVTSKWTAAAPGSTLTFDGATNYARLADSSPLNQLDAVDDLTLEAWVRPNYMEGNARIIQHKSDKSNYVLGLQRPESALAFDGQSYIDLGDGIVLGGSFMQEAWIYPTSDNVEYHGVMGNQTTNDNRRYPPSFWVYEIDKINAGFGDGTNWNSFTTPESVLTLDTWNHVALTFDGIAYKVYVNGALQYETADFAGKQPVNTPLKEIGRADTYFNGRLDEVRLWNRARTAEEIQAEMNHRLSGNEANLAGYWHFEAGARDYSSGKHHGVWHGPLQKAPSALPLYEFFAGVNGQHVQSREVVPAGAWTHLAAVFMQSYGLKFDGLSGYLDCGKDDTLNINTDLTVEVFLQVDELGQERGILTHGRTADGTEQNVPYALGLDRSGHLVFTFEDKDGGFHSYTSSAALAPGTPHRVAVTRKRQSLNYREKSFGDANNKGYTFAWYDVELYLDRQPSQISRYYYDDNVRQAIEEAQKAAPDENKIRGWIGSYPAANFSPVDIGRSNHALEIGRMYPAGFFKGILSEVRIWNTRLEPADIGRDLTAKMDGLVSWWRFEEREGNKAADSAGQNHATLNGSMQWIKDPDPRSRLILYCNDSDPLLTINRAASEFRTASSQFSLGALANSTVQERFQGELEEVRIWRMVRTPEQILDALFRRLNGELDNLLAYYTFDAEAEGRLKDQSLAGHHLAVEGTPFYILSTAPIGEDTPQVRSALAGVRTPFSGLIHSRPSVQEYGDVQYDHEGNLIGVFKRCYGFIKDGGWQLITGFKVGDLVTEWIGQVQFAPQLMGFIEGAPPVPSENLTPANVEQLDNLNDYNAASAVELAEAAETTYTYSSTKEAGSDWEVETALQFGAKSKSEVGFIAITSVEESKFLIGPRARFEQSQSWLEEASAGVTRATGKTTSLELRGRYTTPDEIKRGRERLGPRFSPDNVGLALVQSETADVFALRLRHNNALISFQMRPNPDIPKDWNIIHFPINPRYTKQGSLDGKIGPIADVDYPNAMTYSPDSSYFKPTEAYGLKNRIEREEMELRTYYDQFAAQQKGQPGSLPSQSAREIAEIPALEQKLRRNLVNTYVWTSDGGLFAETQQTMDVQSEVSGGSYDFKWMVGFDFKVAFAIMKVAVGVELNAMFGAHQHLSVNKSRESSTAFQVNASLDNVERDIYQRGAGNIVLVDTTDPKRPKPLKTPYKVDAYRFMTFYLEPNSDHFDLFFNRIVDPIWLAQSDDPAAAALREARDEGKKPACWRMMHRVTYVSRVLPRFEASAPPSLEKTLQTLDIDSNYELIKQLEPYVSNKLSSYADFTDAVRETIKMNLPELQPHTEEVIKYMSLYFGIADGQVPAGREDRFGESTFVELPPNQPPVVHAGLDQIIGLDGPMTTADLDASVIDDRLQKAEAIFVTWEKISGDGNVTFDDPHAPTTKATFTKRGRYVLRLTASDGLLTASDELTIVVNERPVISAGQDQQISTLQAQLAGQILDSGLGDPQSGSLTVVWSKQSLIGEVAFENKKALSTEATFATRGHYLLKLSVSNGTFDADDEIMIGVAARRTGGLQVLYTFEENGGSIVHDVAGVGEPLDLVINDPAAVEWVAGGLAVNAPALLATTDPAARLVREVKSSNEITIEAWVKPAQETVTGLRRVLTLSDGPARRDFILAQSSRAYQVGLRATDPSGRTDVNASQRPIVGGSADPNALMHVACTRDEREEARLYINGEVAANRTISGQFSNWDESFCLALGNELDSGRREDRSWRGEYHLLAVYDRALSQAEIRQNYEFGADNNLPPIVSAGADQVIDWSDVSQQEIATTLNGRVTNDRATPNGSITWAQVGGPGSPNGVRFENAAELMTKAYFAQKGRYVLRLTADDGELLMSDEVVIVVNCPPKVGIKNGATPKFALTASQSALELAGELLDNGLGEDGSADSMSYTWGLVRKSKSIRIENPQQLQTPVTFSKRGVYELSLEASNGRLSTTLPVVITVNQMPVISAGVNQIVTLTDESTAQITLDGLVTDDGLGNPKDWLSILWEKVSGPDGAEVRFDDPTQLQTSAAFTSGGVYLLQLTVRNVDNPELAAVAGLGVTVNRAPVVDAGPDQTLFLSGPAGITMQLDGTVSDDGLPELPGVVKLKWSVQEVQGGARKKDVIILSATEDFTEVQFKRAGVYTFILEADDGAVTVSDTVQVTVDYLPDDVEGERKARVTTKGLHVRSEPIVPGPRETDNTLYFLGKGDAVIVTGTWTKPDGTETWAKLKPDQSHPDRIQWCAMRMDDSTYLEFTD
jgi:hypothetical protein